MIFILISCENTSKTLLFAISTLQNAQKNTTALHSLKNVERQEKPVVNCLQISIFVVSYTLSVPSRSSSVYTKPQHEASASVLSSCTHSATPTKR